MPPYDNNDGLERFWKHYELSLLSEEQLAEVVERDSTIVFRNQWTVTDEDSQKSFWIYLWAVCIYYSVLVIGGNELQPA